jgi:amidohydrolase
VRARINEWVDAIEDEVIAWRRHLHKHPELSFQEKQTAQFVHDTLKSLGNLEIFRPTATSVVARLVGQTAGKVVALRADMDALAMQEENDCDFASQNPGVMHACGHDGHTALLLGTAKILSQQKEFIQGEVRFIFQHAEELFPGGAQQMVDAGVLDGVDMVLGIHFMSHYPLGKVAVCHGYATAGSDAFDLVIQGKGGHAAQPDMSIDPVVIGAQIVSNLQQIVSRYVSPLDKLVVSVTKFQGGTAYNVIPDSVALAGTVRSLNNETREKAPQWIEKIAKGITEAHGAYYTFTYQCGYKSVVNNHEATKLMEEVITNTWGAEALLVVDPLMGGEDFSAFSSVVPGCYMMVGTANPETGPVYPHHHPKYALDEAALAIGVKLYIHAVFRILM